MEPTDNRASHFNSPSETRGGRGALTSPTQHVMNTTDMKQLRRNLRTYGTPAEGGLWKMHGAMPEHDMARDEELRHRYGIRTLRFENKTVFQQPEVIINSILLVQAEVTGAANCTAAIVNAPQPPLVSEGELVTFRVIKN